MLSQTKKNKRCFSWNFFQKNRKGVSLMIGYILLMTIAVVMGILVYNWIKTYVPKEGLACPDEVSIFIEKAVYYEAEFILDVTIKNNGNFNIAGYFIHATNSSEQELAIIDLSEYTPGGEGKGGAVLLGMGENSFKPNQKREDEFNLSGTGIGTIYSVEIIPVRYQEEDNKLRFVSCGNARVGELVTVIPPLIVFLASPPTYRGNSFGSDLQYADEICNNRAGNAGLEGNFVAWLSTDIINAKDRITDGIYILTNGTIIAGSKTELLSGTLIFPINLNEKSEESSSGGIWTGTDEFGYSTGVNCYNWTSDSNSVEGTRGKPDKKNEKWTNYNNEPCNDDARIYCFQI